MPTVETLTLVEHDTLALVARREPRERALDPAQAAALGRLEARLPPGTFRWGHQSVKFAHYCGVLTLGQLSLEILPKLYGLETERGASRQALIRMLHAAKRLTLRRSGAAEVALQKHVLLDVFVLHFCDLLHAELMQGMIRHYVNRDENLGVLRGKLVISQQLRHNLVHRERLYCRYDELRADNRYNRIIKAVLAHLLRLPLSSYVRKQLGELLMRFDGVRNIAADRHLLDTLTFDRTQQRYRPIFEQCRWFLDGLQPDVVAGQAGCLTLLFDMNRLFEAYAADRLRRLAWQRGLRVREQGPRYHLARRENPNKAVFALCPDLTLLDTDNRVLAIADAKWKVINQEQGNLGIEQSDLYQMIAYAARYRVTELVLLYPRQRRLTETVAFTVPAVDARVSAVPVDVTASRGGLNWPFAVPALAD